MPSLTWNIELDRDIGKSIEFSIIFQFFKRSHIKKSYFAREGTRIFRGPKGHPRGVTHRSRWKTVTVIATNVGNIVKHIYTHSARCAIKDGIMSVMSVITRALYSLIMHDAYALVCIGRTRILTASPTCKARPWFTDCASIIRTRAEYF